MTPVTYWTVRMFFGLAGWLMGRRIVAVVVAPLPGEPPERCPMFGVAQQKGQSR